MSEKKTLTSAIPFSIFSIKKYDEQRLHTDKDSFYAIKNFLDSLTLTKKINEAQSGLDNPKYVKAAELNAVGLISSILRIAFEKYKENFLEDLEIGVETATKESLGDEFSDFFKKIDNIFEFDKSLKYKERYGEVLIRTFIIDLFNQNPAFENYKQLFDDTRIKETTNFQAFSTGFYNFFQDKPTPSDKFKNFIDYIKEPFLKYPNSIFDQLKFIKDHWIDFLGDYILQLLLAMDQLKEENKFGGMGPGPVQTPDYSIGDEEYENFTEDKDWMPKVILLAKSTLVWLDQLSKYYKREIHRLDQIPDEEIARISNSGFTGLWLIGLWQRSQASKNIKRMCGNPDAEASAYSLHDYDIAWELGGWEALEKLRQQCRRFNLRLASDMVPNHTAIDSRWVIQHPDWFLQLPYQPYPQYSYNGTNLSNQHDVGIYLEDHYYDRTDAAVTFKRVDFNTGETRYIYHGNDGTSMPWNDTAQINYLNPEAREAVIQTVLHVARNFPIIRFDAAMTLAKRHIQRLWFPEPGSGGDIPTRAEHGLSRHDFDKQMPVEFWREVVDRIQAELPDTLLLAEAFWMMEGYFVRTLGMHRVYNSAFMHMMKNEDNEKYRNMIKETLAFEPEILKRFVNFMNNPDEETAAEQYGKGDKYIGVCVMLSTMPGLPMFGHGQVEGFYEKYGMEYRRALWDETPDYNLIQRHEREIFPLLKKRYLFAEVQNFILYDFYHENGSLDQNVYAYSNKAGEETALVVYNNSYYETYGTIKYGAPKKDKASDSTYSPDLNTFIYMIGQQNGHNPCENSHEFFVIFRESSTDFWYIRKAEELCSRGLFCHLKGYQHQIFMNFYTVKDSTGIYSELCEKLNGHGARDIDYELKMLYFAPLHRCFDSLINTEFIDNYTNAIFDGNKVNDAHIEFAANSVKLSLQQLPEKFIDIKESASKITKSLTSALEKANEIALICHDYNSKSDKSWKYGIATEILSSGAPSAMLLTSTLIEALSVLNENFYNNYMLKSYIERKMQSIGLEENVINEILESVQALTILLRHNFSEIDTSPVLKDFLGTNYWNNEAWFIGEKMELLIWADFFKSIISEETNKPEAAEIENIKKIAKKNLEAIKGKIEKPKDLENQAYEKALERQKAIKRSEYRIQSFLKLTGIQ
ncbi:MAG: hypothetical protein JXR63_10370 [Spirochaetales bacterium]|nr:hypothetical protein [Spirochaetales bacterium]